MDSQDSVKGGQFVDWLGGCELDGETRSHGIAAKGRRESLTSVASSRSEQAAPVSLLRAISDAQGCRRRFKKKRETKPLEVSQVRREGVMAAKIFTFWFARPTGHGGTYCP